MTPVPTGPQSEPVDRASCPQALDRTGTSSLGVLSRQGLSQSPWTEPAARRSWTEPGQGTPGSCQSEAAGRPRGDLASRTWLLSWPLTSAPAALRGGLCFLLFSGKLPCSALGLGGWRGKGRLHRLLMSSRAAQPPLASSKGSPARALFQALMGLERLLQGQGSERLPEVTAQAQ